MSKQSIIVEGVSASEHALSEALTFFAQDQRVAELKVHSIINLQQDEQSQFKLTFDLQAR